MPEHRDLGTKSKTTQALTVGIGGANCISFICTALKVVSAFEYVIYIICTAPKVVSAFEHVIYIIAM